MSHSHGSTPAAWTTVVLAIVGFCVAGVAVVAASPAWFFAGIAIAILGAIVGKAMQLMGLGKRRYAEEVEGAKP